MKLLTKNSIYFLLITLLVFCIGGYVFYFKLQTIIHEEAIEQLNHKKTLITNFIAKQNKLPEGLSNESEIAFYPSTVNMNTQLTDTVIFVQWENEMLPFKQLQFGVTVAGQKYRAVIRKPMFESDDLIETIIRSFIYIAFLLTAILLILNYIYSRSVWKPFMHLLHTISKYQIEKHKVITPVKTGTHEFDQLSEAIQKMTFKIYTDFENLKSFTENASHELQTPLAIIKTKTEQLLQSPNLNEEQQKQVYAINQTSNKLSKLNQTLLLFAKIENNQFQTTAQIDFSKIVFSKLEQFEDLISIKHIKITKTISENVQVTIHPILAEMVVSNLLSNALKYCDERGEIELELNYQALTIANSGKPIAVPSDKLFERFFKLDANSESTGLGLALIKQIATLNKHAIVHEYKNNKHYFHYYFSTELLQNQSIIL